MIKFLLLQQKINERIKEINVFFKEKKQWVEQWKKDELLIEKRVLNEVLIMMEVICKED